MVRLIIYINIGVFLAWQSASQTNVQFMMDNFLVSWLSLMEGRVWTLITSVFSHTEFWHIFINMFVLNSFGPIMERVLGSWSFIRFYIVAGIVSSFCHSIVSAWILKQADLPALGASGAISGLILVFSLLFPKQKILLFAIIPIPALWGALVFVGLDLWGLISQAEGGTSIIGHGAHLGGAIAGAVYYFFWLRPKYVARSTHFTRI